MLACAPPDKATAWVRVEERAEASRPSRALLDSFLHCLVVPGCGGPGHEGEAGEDAMKNRGMVTIALGMVAVLVYFWAVSVIERQGFAPDHPDAVEVDSADAGEQHVEDKSVAKLNQERREAKRLEKGREERSDPKGITDEEAALLLGATLVLAGLAFLMHLRRGGKTHPSEDHSTHRYSHIRKRRPDHGENPQDADTEAAEPERDNTSGELPR